MMSTATLAPLEVHRSRLEKHLDSLFPETTDGYSGLQEAARYAVLGGGKRLRPVLSLAIVDALRGDTTLALHPACAIELVHAYSLVHDDLPCMDDDDYRRGRPTLHKVVPEGIAMLTGDLLLTKAFELLSTAPGLSPQQRIELVATLSSRAGTNGLVGGQYLDLTATPHATTLADVESIHLGKTAALITAAIEFGGIVSDASPGTLEALRRFGMHLGLAFQIADDIIDVTASEAKHGSAQGSDLANGKATYVTLLGVDGARECAAASANDAMMHLDSLSGDLSIVKDLAHRLVYREL